MKVTVKKKETLSRLPIGTEYIKLQDAMKLMNLEIGRAHV